MQPDPIDGSVVEYFEISAATFPHHIAIRDGIREISYLELNRRANQLAREILAHNPGNAPIPFYLGYDISTVIALLGIIKTGCPFVVLDPSFPVERNQLILSGLDACLLITDTVHKASAESCTSSAAYPILINLDDLSSRLDGENLGISISPEMLFCIIFTSGSTGAPKGVMCSHRYMVFSNSQPASLMNITPGDKLSFFTPFTYTAAVGYLLKTIFKGARACLYDARTRGLAGMAEWLEAEGVTVLVAPPSSFRAIFNSLPENKLLEQLRFVHTGGEKTALADVTLFRAHTTPSCVLLFTLSSTETTAITLLSVDHSMPVTETTVITGYPLPGHEIFLLDENRQPVKPGETGEIAVRTRYLASGYWKQPELTAKKFVQDPHDPRIHTFFTGDLGRWLPDGALQFQGRKDDMVKIRGHRVEIREVESALSKHPAILQSVVTAPADPLENSQKWLVAYYVQRPDTRLDEIELRKFLSGLLPAFMVPSRLISLNALPLNSHGKVDVKALPEPFQPGAKLESGTGSSNEQVLLNLWASVFGQEKIGLQDDFFELGGNSLTAVRLLAGVDQLFGTKMPLPLFDKYRTVQDMAGFIKSAPSNQIASPEQISPYAGRKAPDAKEDLSWTHGVVPLQTEGSKTPIFISPASLYMNSLALGFAPDRPVFGLTPVEKGQVVYHSSVKEEAMGYYRSLIEFLPHGPYLLLGHSGFGFFTLELGRLLRQNGKKDVFIGLLDSFPPGPRHQARLIDRIVIHLDNLRRKNPRGIIEYFKESIDRFSERSSRRMPTQRIVCYQENGDLYGVQRILQLHYQPEQIDFPVTLFSATERLWYVRWDPMENWHKFLREPFGIIRVPGDHLSSLEPPHVAEFVEKIKQQIQKFENSL
jgi:amino acid adenylation domain-containing protein